MTELQLCKLMDDCETRGYKDGWDAGYKAGLNSCAKAPVTDALAGLARGDSLQDVIYGILNG